MSRLAKQPIQFPKGVEVTFASGVVSVKGPKGELKREVPETIGVSVENGAVAISAKAEDALTLALVGTYASHIKNMMLGVSEGYQKTLLIEGVGYRAEVRGTNLVLNVGFSHQVTLPIPQGIQMTVEKGVMTITGIDKEVVGQFSAVVRAQKKPEPYKGKGIRYSDEYILRKQGKRAVG